MLYRKRPVVIEADQWDGTLEGATKIIDWILSHDGTARYHDHALDGRFNAHPDGYIVIETLEGKMYASTYDYIIRDTYNEFYPCKPDFFVGTYEKV